MSAEQHIGLIFKRFASLLFSLVMLCGILQATPIVSPANFQAQDFRAQQRTAFSVISTNNKIAPDISTTETAVKSSFGGLSPRQAVTSGCIFANDCQNPVDIPEPQSLALVGAGLMSMANVIRRRLRNKDACWSVITPSRSI
jgi:hypothetical protein